MSRTKPIPLLKLPDLMLEMVLARTTIAENISTCSENCFQTVRDKLHREKFKLSLETEKAAIYITSADLKLTIIADKGKWYEFEDGQEENHKGYIQGTRFNQKSRGSFIRTFWADRNSGVKLLLGHLTRLFSTPIDSVFYSDFSETIYNDPLDILKSINNLQDSLQTVALHLTRLPDDYYGRIFNELKFVKNLHIRHLTTGNYFEDNDQRIWKHEELKIDDGYWITTGRLFTMNCKILIIEESILSASDLNKYLKYWIRGSFPNLEQLYINGNELTVSRVLAGIKHLRNPERVLGVQDRNDFRRKRSTTPVDIRRCDGTIGTLFISKGNYDVNFIVWK
ncbi:unnamed protein product [Caenorhabditis brenneri]